MKSTFFSSWKPRTKLLVICLFLALGYFSWARLSVSDYNPQNIASSYTIDYPANYHHKQISTYCGPFSVAAVTRILTGKTVDSFEFADNITWKILDKGTHPIGLIKQLEDQGLKVEAPRLRNFSDNERLAFLQERLSQGKPIILLGEKDSEQHYVTLLGFNQKHQTFYIYDSSCKEGQKGFVIDENGLLPGNLTLSRAELLEFWGKGGIYSFYEWYALVASR